jgi:hypothetical protein
MITTSLFGITMIAVSAILSAKLMIKFMQKISKINDKIYAENT